jgi:hypothetical protein
MKKTYIIIFIVAIVVTTLLVITALSQFSTSLSDKVILIRYTWLSGCVTFFNFSFTTVLLVIAHLALYREKLGKQEAYWMIGLPYAFFIIFTQVNYTYMYELYNVYQEKSLEIIDTPEMPVFALNVSVFAAMIGAINLVLIKVMGNR